MLLRNKTCTHHADTRPKIVQFQGLIDKEDGELNRTLSSIIFSRIVTFSRLENGGEPDPVGRKPEYVLQQSDTSACQSRHDPRLVSRLGQPDQRACEVFRHCFDQGLLIRVTADIIALSPPLIASTEEVDRLFFILGDALYACAD